MGSALGLSAFYHDSAAALVIGSKLVAAAQQERFSRVKHDAMFPIDAARFCLIEAGLRLRDLDAVVFYEDPAIKRDRIVDTIGRKHPHQEAFLDLVLPDWLAHPDLTRERVLSGLRRLDDDFDPDRLRFIEHHRSHAASAYFPSPFDRAAVLTVDGAGEWATTTIHRGDGMRLEFIEEIRFPNSIGLLYAAFTTYLGFRVNDGEYKMMGLAPYGKPRYEHLIAEHLIVLHVDGSFTLAQEYFDYFASERMFNERFTALFGMPPRGRDDPLTQFHMDVAASIQAVTTTALLRLARAAVHATGSRNLCLAGGVALNCVANGHLLRSGIVDELWIQPAAGDAGGAVGAAFVGAFAAEDAPARRMWSGYDGMGNAALGPGYTQTDIEAYLSSVGATYRAIGDREVIDETVAHLAAGRVVGWFQGRMEFGPRALGYRSILADPRSPSMQTTLNLKTKARESFRPFAPAVLREQCVDWFDLDAPSPYMLLVAEVAAGHRVPLAAGPEVTGLDKLNELRSTIPAVTHVDYSARVQTVERDANPLFHALIAAFGDRTGVPVLVNTSFNVSDEPIVCSPDDAYRCLLGTQIDVLVMGRCVMLRDEQRAVLPALMRLPPSTAFDYMNGYCVQWYAEGVTHLAENRFTETVTSAPIWHLPGADVLHSGRMETWWESLRIAARFSTLILACGGSTSAFNNNWPAFIGPRLAERGYDAPIVTVNLAQPQFATFDEYYVLEWFLREARRRGITPDLVISLDGINDLGYRLFAAFWAARYNEYDTAAPNELRLLDQLGRRRIYDRIPLAGPLRAALHGSMDAPLAAFPEFALPDAAEADLMASFAATLGAFRSVAAAAGLPCISVLQPILTRSEGARREAQLRATYAEAYAEFRRAQPPEIAANDALAFERFRRTRFIRLHIDESYAVSPEPGMRAPFMLRTDTLRARASALWRELGAERDRPDVLDLLDTFRNEDAIVYRDDGVHYTVEGSRALADRIATWVLVTRPDVLPRARHGADATELVDHLQDVARAHVPDRERVLALAAAGVEESDRRFAAIRGDRKTAWRRDPWAGAAQVDEIRQITATFTCSDRPTTVDPEPGNLYPLY
jgi:carbamoyltransferase